MDHPMPDPWRTPKPLINSAEAASILNVSIRTVERLRLEEKEHPLPWVPVGKRSVRFEEAQVRQWMAERQERERVQRMERQGKSPRRSPESPASS